MKTIILCGGKGTRMKEETEYRPKPMVEIGGQPMLWHIMKIYAHHGYGQFILTLGYKSNMIKDYFLKHHVFSNDLTWDAPKNSMEFHSDKLDDFKITFADTGLESFTGERILRCRKYLNDEDFMITYGDGVGNVNIEALVEFHRRQNTVGTITGVHPYSKYGLVGVDAEKNLVTSFRQKPVLEEYINGGFMVFKKDFFDYLDGRPVEDALGKLVQARQLSIFRHDGFWKAMDTYAEMEELNRLWQDSRPWAVWEK